MDVLWWLLPLGVAFLACIVLLARWAAATRRNPHGPPLGLLMGTLLLQIPANVAFRLHDRYEAPLAWQYIVLFLLLWGGAGALALWAHRGRYGVALPIMAFGWGPLAYLWSRRLGATPDGEPQP